MVLALTWMDRVANSTPIVDFESRLNSLRVKRLSRLDLPTPESPIRTTGATRISRSSSDSYERSSMHTLEQKLRR